MYKYLQIVFNYSVGVNVLSKALKVAPPHRGALCHLLVTVTLTVGTVVD